MKTFLKFQIYLFTLLDDEMTFIHVINFSSLSGALYNHDPDQFLGKPIIVKEAQLVSDKLAIFVVCEEQNFVICYNVNIGTLIKVWVKKCRFCRNLAVIHFIDADFTSYVVDNREKRIK